MGLNSGRVHKIKPRFGAIGKRGSLADLDRALRTIKAALQLSVVRN